MSTISIEIMQTIDEREMQKWRKKTTTEKQRQTGARGTEATVKGWELNEFVVHIS